MDVVHFRVERREEVSHLVLIISLKVVTCKEVTLVPVTVTMCYVIPKGSGVAVDEIEAESHLIA